MRTIDFREVLADELQDPEVRRAFIVAHFEQDGANGLHRALDEIARADAPHPSAPEPQVADTLMDLRHLLRQNGLDLGIVRLDQSDTSRAGCGLIRTSAHSTFNHEPKR